MGPLIKDRFAKKTKDRRERWRLRARAAGRCIDCGSDSKTWRCRPCGDHANELARVRRAMKKEGESAAPA